MNYIARLAPKLKESDALSCARFGVYVEPLTIDRANQLVNFTEVKVLEVRRTGSRLTRTPIPILPFSFHQNG